MSKRDPRVPVRSESTGPDPVPGPDAATPTRDVPETWPSVARRSPVRITDLRVVQRAGTLIEELGDELDARLRGERRADERLRMLRETTNRITRTANDAVLAYQRASRSVAAALARPNADRDALAAIRGHLDAARAGVLTALDAAGRRYPTVEPDTAAAPPAADSNDVEPREAQG